MVLGHNDAFAYKWGRAIRETFSEWCGPLAGLRIRSDTKAGYDWRIHGRRGACIAANVRALSGYGCELMIGDDIIKDQASANSPTIRGQVWESWNADAYGTRLQPGGKCILVMSRRHLDDPIGRIVKAMKPGDNRWEVIRLPALADSLDDPLGRSIGEPLWAGRFNKQELEGIRDEQYRFGTGYLWETLRQQNPCGDPTSTEWPTEYFRVPDLYYDEIPPGLHQRFRILVIDPSKGSKNKSGDYACFLDLVGTPGPALWCEPYMRQMPSEDVVKHAVGMLQTGKYQACVVDANVGQDLIGRYIHSKCRDAGVNIPIHLYTCKEDKNTRIRLRVGPPFALRRVKLRNPYSCPSTNIAREQLTQWPTADHDDFPDSLEMALQYINWMHGGKVKLMETGTKMELVQ